MVDEQKRDYKDQESPDFVDDLSEGGGHKYYVKNRCNEFNSQMVSFFWCGLWNRKREKNKCEKK